MRVLHVVTDTDRRGAQLFGWHLHNALSELGHDTPMVALTPGSGSSRLPIDVLGTSRWARSTWTGLRRRLEEADVAIAFGSSTLPACGLLSFATSTPFVYRQISDSVVWSPTWGRRARTRLWLKRAAHVVALSAGNRDQLVEHLSVRPDRITVIPSGRPIEAFSPVRRDHRPAARAELGLPDRPTALFLGALSWEKGPDLAIRAIASLADLQLVMAGKGPEEAGLRTLADDVAPGRVQFVGPVDEIGPWFAAADLLVLPSRTEAMPGSLIEAGLSQLPSVASAVGAVPEVVTDGVSGLLVVADDVDALSGAIRRVVDDHALADRIALHARRHCLERFDIRRVAEQWERVLVEAASASR